MRLLIIEDDEPKMREMKNFIDSLNLKVDVLITQCMSYQSGLRSIILKTPDLILLDMSIPTYDRCGTDPKGGPPKPFGGRDILREVKRKMLNCKVIVVTQYAVLKDSDKEEKTLEELKTTFEENFPSHFLGTVFYKHSEDSWQEPLRSLIVKFITSFCA